MVEVIDIYKTNLHVISMKPLNDMNVKPVINKCNGQINFSLKKTALPEHVKDKLPKLKGIKLNVEDFEFEL